MKKLLLAMFTLSVVGVASAQSYNHEQVQNRGHNGYSTVHLSQESTHENYSNGHNNDYRYEQQHPAVNRGHESTIIVTDRHERQEAIHLRRDNRRYNNGHDY